MVWQGLNASPSLRWKWGVGGGGGIVLCLGGGEEKNEGNGHILTVIIHHLLPPVPSSDSVFSQIGLLAPRW